MFTGLVEELVSVVHLEVRQSGAAIELSAKRIIQDMNIGDSIAVNGVCLTVIRFTNATFTLQAVPETLRKTNLGGLKPGDRVHAERAMAANGRFGGHMVSGHIDGMGVLQHRSQEGIAHVLTIAAPLHILRYVVPKGSICVDGVSLTVMDVSESTFQVSIIPHTGHATMLGVATIGAKLNLECDVLAKYMEKMLQTHAIQRQSATEEAFTARTINIDLLAKHGFV